MILDSLYTLKLLPDKSTPEFDFSVSSAFPFYGEYLFFPIPLDFCEKFPNRYIDNQKMLFISQNLLENYFTETPERIYQSGCFLAEENHPIHMVHPIYKTVVFPIYSGDICHTLKSIRFRKDAGLYFFVRTQSKNAEKQISIALNFLKDQGIGKKRNSGRGNFIFTKFKTDLNIQSNEKSILISLYHPQKEDVGKDFFKTSLSHWIKRTKKPLFGTEKDSKYLRMAKEGTVFFKTPSKPIGSVSKLFNKNKQCDTPIYRIGKAFLIGNKR